MTEALINEPFPLTVRQDDVGELPRSVSHDRRLPTLPLTSKRLHWRQVTPKQDRPLTRSHPRHLTVSTTRALCLYATTGPSPVV
jgi:hypothetical protein